jgi:hypothetical protein
VLCSQSHGGDGTEHSLGCKGLTDLGEKLPKKEVIIRRNYSSKLAVGELQARRNHLKRRTTC